MAGWKKSKGSWRSQNEWQSLLAKFGGSGMGVEAFCQREAISAASFYRWRSRLRHGGDGGAAEGGPRRLSIWARSIVNRRPGRSSI